MSWASVQDYDGTFVIDMLASLRSRVRRSSHQDKDLLSSNQVAEMALVGQDDEAVKHRTAQLSTWLLHKKGHKARQSHSEDEVSRKLGSSPLTQARSPRRK